MDRPRLKENGTCRYCRALIRWVRTADGHAIPMDLEARAGGNIEIVADMLGESVAEYRHPDDTEARYVSHSMTCPHVAANRRKREEKANAKRSGVGNYRNDAARMRVENPWKGHW